MKTTLKLLLFGLFLTSYSQPAAAVATGRKAAMKYFQHKKSRQSKGQSTTTPDNSTFLNNYEQIITFSAGAMFNGKAYKWVGKNVGGWSMQLDFRKKMKSRSWLAKSIQLEFQKFEFEQNELSKVSLLYSLIFPRSLTFPIYMGVAGGVGAFLTQAPGESLLSIDYKGFCGLRMNQSHTQIFLESGVKNHVHVLSDGQYLGWFIASGVAYKF